jgi:hypothetical protein
VQADRQGEGLWKKWVGRSGAHGLQIFSLTISKKGYHMTLDTTTPTPSTAMKPEQHHTKAAEHLTLAAKSHHEVAKLIVANDHTAAHTHAKVAEEHLTQAKQHADLAKKAMPASK